MEVVSSFEIDAAPDPVWELLLDVPRVIPCMPGAELVEVVDESSWKARVGTRLGPMSLDFDVDVAREEVDETSRSVRLAARASDRSGRGGATATITSQLEATDAGGSGVEVTTDLALTGAVARFGRQGLVRDVAAQMTDQFAANLRRELLGPDAVEAPAAADGPRPSPSPNERDGEISTGKMILGLLLRAWIRRLERMLERVERPGGGAG